MVIASIFMDVESSITILRDVEFPALEASEPSLEGAAGDVQSLGELRAVDPRRVRDGVVNIFQRHACRFAFGHSGTYPSSGGMMSGIRLGTVCSKASLYSGVSSISLVTTPPMSSIADETIPAFSTS